MITSTRLNTSVGRAVGAPSAARLMIEGARDITPMIIGVVPFGLAIGATVGASSLSAVQGLLSTAIFAGAAQLTVVQMLDAGAGPLIIVLSALMINARLLLYSASLAPWFRDESVARRMALATPVIDQLHFTCVPRFEQCDLDQRGRRWYYSGAAGSLAGSWVVVQSIAIFAGATLPAWTGLHIAAPLALAGLLAKATAMPHATTAALVAGVVAVIGTGLPYQSSVLAATLAGIATATAASRRGVRS